MQINSVYLICRQVLLTTLLFFLEANLGAKTKHEILKLLNKKMVIIFAAAVGFVVSLVVVYVECFFNLDEIFLIFFFKLKADISEK